MDGLLKVKTMQAMAKRAKAVTDMEIDEISLVDRPANQHALVTIAKRANEEDAVPEEFFDETGEQVDVDQLEDGEVVYDADGNAFQYTEDGAEAEVEGEPAEIGKDKDFFRGHGTPSGGRYAAAMLGGPLHGAVAGKKGRKLGAFGTEIGGSLAGQTAGTVLGLASRNPALAREAGMAGHYGGAAGAVALNQRSGRYKPQPGRGAVAKSFADEVREELSKALDDGDRDAVISKALGRLAEYEEEIAEAQEIAKSERDLRLTREYISKAAEYNVPVEPEELGPVLMHMAEALPYEDCAVIHKALSAAGQMLFDELGFQGEADNLDPFSMVEEQLESQVAKGAGSVSKAEQVTEFFDNDPRAYDEYRANLGR